MPDAPPPLAWSHAARHAWLGAALAGLAEVAWVVGRGPEAPGPVAALALVGLALVWPGGAGAIAGVAARAWRPSWPAAAVGGGVGVGICVLGQPTWAVVPALAAAGLGAVLPRRALPLAGLAAAIALALALAPRTGPQPPQGAPSALVITLAGVGANVEAAGVGLPGLAAVSSRGVRFTRAQAPIDADGPSLAALWTGLAPWEGGALFDGDPLPAEADTAAARLRAAGWRTAAFTSDPLPDLLPGVHRGFDRFDAEPTWLIGATRTAGGRLVAGSRGPRPAHVSVDRARRWIRRQDGPWLAWVHLHDARGALAPPPPFDERYVEPDPAAIDAPTWSGLPVGVDAGTARGRLLGTVAAADAQVAQLLAEIDWERTIVVWAGTRGTALGEGGRWLDAAPGEAAWAVPLAIAAPGARAGAEVPVPVELGDVAATLLDLAGLVDGPDSLRGAIERGEVRRSGARSVGWTGSGWVASVRARHGRATVGAAAAWEPTAEPSPLLAVAGEDPIRALLDRRAAQVLDALAAAPDPGPPPSADRLRALGYRPRPE